MSGAIRGCGVLSRESRAQAGELVVTHPFCLQSLRAAISLLLAFPYSS